MKQVMVKLEDELQKEAKIEAIRQNKSLTQYVSDLVKKELETKKEQTQKL
jgi:predicted HicB family RNase H-like nuclease